MLKNTLIFGFRFGPGLGQNVTRHTMNLEGVVPKLAEFGE